MSRRRMMFAKEKLVEVVEELTVSGTWTVPAGCTSVDAFLVGGGGAGGSGVTGSGPDGGGGGGGYTKIFYNILVTPGSRISYIIGAGGIRPYNREDRGTAGGYTQFLNTSYRAEGGNPGGNKYTGPPYAGDGGSGGVRKIM